MSTCPQDETLPTTIAAALTAMGPRTVEGDQGRVTMHSVDDAIKASNYQRSRNAMGSRRGIRNVLRTISNNRLLSHDGRAS